MSLCRNHEPPPGHEKGAGVYGLVILHPRDGRPLQLAGQASQQDGNDARSQWITASTMHTVPLLYANNKLKGMAQFHSPSEIPLSLGAGRKLLLD